MKSPTKKSGKKSGKHNILYAIILFALILSVLNLGDRYFWGDEVHLLHLGDSITKYGLPVLTTEIRHEDITYETDDITNKTISEIVFSIKPEDFTTKLFGEDIYVMHSWLLMYIEAGAISIFGLYNEFFIRLFFVIIGLIAIPFTYALAMHITKKKEIANLSAFLLACSVVYLLAIRNANYYALIIASVPAAIYFYLKMIEDKKDANKHMHFQMWGFALASAVIFHSNWLVFAGTMLGIGIHFVIYEMCVKHKILAKKSKIFKPVIKSIKDARYFIYSLIIIFLLTAPWFIWTQQYSKSSIHTGLKDYILLLFASAYQFVIWFVPVLFIIILAVMLFNKKNRKELLRKEYVLFVIILLSYFLLISLNKYSGAPIRYYYGLLPIAMIINAIVIYFLWKKTKIVATLVIVLFIFTNLIQIAPIIPLRGIITSELNSNNVLNVSSDTQIGYLEESTTPKMLMIDYSSEITRHVQTPTESIVDYMRERHVAVGAPVFIGSGDPNTVGYYTKTDVHTYAPNFNTREYSFIVLDASDDRNKEIDMNKYEKEYFPLETYKWGDTADPTHHVYMTTYGEGFYVYHKT